jgi:hypothetical protein
VKVGCVADVSEEYTASTIRDDNASSIFLSNVNNMPHFHKVPHSKSRINISKCYMTQPKYTG